MDNPMMAGDDDEEEDEKKQDSSELVLHEFVYKLKSYFMESERALRVPGLLKDSKGVLSILDPKEAGT